MFYNKEQFKELTVETAGTFFPTNAISDTQNLGFWSLNGSGHY